MIDPKLVRGKLASLQEHLGHLRPLATTSIDLLRKDPIRRGAAERFVQLVVDTAVDVNNHVLIESGHAPGRDYYGSFIGLARIGVLSDRLARALGGTTGIRNRLVHNYETVDISRFHRSLPPLIRNYTKYVAAIRRHVKV